MPGAKDADGVTVPGRRHRARRRAVSLTGGPVMAARWLTARAR